MNLEMFFKNAFAIDVYNILKTQVDRMAQRHSCDRGSLLEVERHENLSEDYLDLNWRAWDGFLFKIEVRVLLTRYGELNWDYISELYPNPGLIPVEVTPLGPEQEPTTVRVLIDWHPLEDIPEIRPYFMEMMQPWEEAFGGVMYKLVDQAPVLAFYNTCEPEWDPVSEDWHFWFGYYEAVKGTDQKIGLEYIADRIGESLSKVEKKRSPWKEQWQKEIIIIS